jgi:(p)ppGpp synthase/HD superfamily hydrolase
MNQTSSPSSRMAAARRFATERHAGQVRRGSGKPYVTHPAQVARIISAAYHDEDLTVAAWLHDTVEDKVSTIVEINTVFGPRVAALVGAVSAPLGANWRDTRAKALARLGGAPADAVRLKAADGLSNLRSLRADIRAAGRAGAFARSRYAGEADLRWYHSAICATARARLGAADPVVVLYQAALVAVWSDLGR